MFNLNEKPSLRSVFCFFEIVVKTINVLTISLCSDIIVLMRKAMFHRIKGVFALTEYKLSV